MNPTTYSTLQSQRLFEKSKALIPGGVNSPVRAFGAVGGSPVFMDHAKGTYLYDVDGNRYIDMINSWGPMVLGHAFPPIIEAIQEQLNLGQSYGTPTEAEFHMAEQITSMVDFVDQVRLVSSGTEACMSCLRLARGFTGKSKFIKFAGNYHGHADPFLVKAGSGLLSFGIPGSAGVPQGATQDTLVAEYNDLEGVTKIFNEHGNDMAAVIIEPVAGNSGCIPGQVDFLKGLRALCDHYGVLLIFDEVMTGFRLARGGAADLYGIQPDLVTYGKVIGGGLPVGAFGGRMDIMQHLAPAGPVYQAGTLSGNPIAVASGLATLKHLDSNPSIYSALEHNTSALADALRAVLDEHLEGPYAVNQMGSMMSIHFGVDEVKNASDASAADLDKFNQLFHFMLARGVYLPPSAFESYFLCQDFGNTEIEHIVKEMKEFLQGA